MAGTLAPAARRGYGLGSVATGSFATVPGLLLLPYLTDRLGIAAGLAGVIVFLPKAWDVLLNPVAGQISDRSTNPAGRRRPFLLRAGLTLAVAFVLLFWGPVTPQGLAAGWVVVLFLVCASAYAFFQVPYIAMPAEMTDDYSERTRLMTWRVTILALAILVSGGLSPMVRNQLGPELGVPRGRGLRRAAHRGGHARAPGGAPGTCRWTPTAPPGASLREQLRIVARARDFRILLAAFVIQALATGAMLAGVDYVARELLGSSGMSTVLFVCFVGPALLVTPLWQRYAESRDKRVGLPGGLAAARRRGAGHARHAEPGARAGAGDRGGDRDRLRRVPDVPAVDAGRRRRGRRDAHRLQPGRASTPGCGPPGRRSGWRSGRSCSPRCSRWAGTSRPPRDRRRSRTRRSRRSGWGFTVVPAVLVALSLVFVTRYGLDEAEVRRAREVAA